MDFCKKFRLWDTFVFERSDRALEMCMASGTSPKEFLTVSHSSRLSLGDETDLISFSVVHPFLEVARDK